MSTNAGLTEVQLKEPEQAFMYPDLLFYMGKASLVKHPMKKVIKEETNRQREYIRKAVCALLNSGGGILLIESHEDFDFSKDGIRQDLEDELRKLIYKSTVQEYCDFSQKETKQKYLIIFVKTWGMPRNGPRLCTLDTGLYIRNLSSKEMADAMQVLYLIERKSLRRRICYSTFESYQRSFIKSLLKRDYLCLGKNLDFTESNYVEFKDFSTDNLQKRIKEVIKPYTSAFGNHNGGCLIIGVDDKAVVKGCGRDSKKSDLETYIKEDLKSLIFVHLNNCESKNEFYTLTIKDVRDEKNHTGYVIFLQVEPFCCLGFVKDPQSWILDTELDNCLVKPLQPKQLTASEWVKIMTDQDLESSLELQCERLTIEGRPPLAKPAYIKKGVGTLLELQHSLFSNIEDKLTIKPDKLYEDLKAEHPGLEDLLKTILPNTGAVIVSRSWAVDVEQKSNPNVVCDILLLSPNDYPTLYSVFNAEVTEEDFSYSRITAFALKQKLVNIGCYTGRLCVIPKMLRLNAAAEISSFSWPEITYPRRYKLLDLGTVKQLLQSLTIVILSFRNMLSKESETQFFNLLFTDQYRGFSENKIKEVSVLHRPPETEKSLPVTEEIIKRREKGDNSSADDHPCL